MKLLLAVVIFAAVTYYAVRWLQAHGYDEPAQRARPRRPQPPTRPVAPDDDEGFLRDLEWKRRQQERHQAPDEPPGEPGQTDPSGQPGQPGD